jgi:DNA helicase-2/ATP-dependent DNA helicase PcrA
MSDFLQQLNDSQRNAVLYNEGPSLVIAGAGSGKTRVLTYKIAYLLQQGIAPWNILALTFTNKAAREMKTRIGALVGEEDARRLWMGTFHSIFAKILRFEAPKIDRKADFTIYDAQDSQNLIKSIIKELQLNDDKLYKPSVVQSRISQAKNAIITPDLYAADYQIREDDRNSHRDRISEIYKIYWNRCRAAGALDFDDLLLFTYLLFKNHPESLDHYRNRFRFILVDEYQDTNSVQHEIVRQLADEHHRVCVVGDDAQSIYSFRGANIGNILNFQTTYPETRLFKLEQNYRSTQTIVNAANSLIAKNKEQIPKKVFSNNEVGDTIRVLCAYSDYDEGYNIAGRIAEMRMMQKYDYQDFAILYRTNAQSRIFEEALRKINIPYRIYGGLSFYQRKEIKDVIAYMRLVANPDDEEALKRIINYPTRGIGDTTVGKITAAAVMHGVSLWTVVCNPAAFNLNINAGTANKLSGFRTLIATFIEDNKAQNAHELGCEIIRKTGLYADLYADRTPEGVSRVQNIDELQNSLYSFVTGRLEEGSDEVRIADFLAEVSLLTDQDSDNGEENNRVTMMTVHAAKGLEFKNVFVVGLEEELFPSERTGSERELEEERRLFYVAITRARDNVTLSYAKTRFRRGESITCRPSRFIRNIDAKYLTTPGDLNTVSGINSININRNTTGRVPSYYVNQRTIAPVNNTTAATVVSRSSIGNFHVGQSVMHDRFGAGTIIELSGESDNAKANVDFKNFGKKQMLLKFAKLRVAF